MTSLTPIEVFTEAAERGLKLGLKAPATLIVESAKRWPRDFAETLRDYKPRLLTLLQLPFVMVYSRALEETIFFCEDEATKDALVEAGADEWSIYTKRELRQLIAQNRIAPISDDELRKLHEIKQTFGARIAPNDL
jgi:hypothetical protein